MKIFSLTNPYKQLTIHNIECINFPNAKQPEPQPESNINTPEKRHKYKYQSTMEKFINEAVLQLDGIVSIPTNKYKHPKPKVRKPKYPKIIQWEGDKEEAEVVKSVQRGQQYSIKCFSDDLQEKYESHEIQTERPYKFQGRNRVFSLEHRKNSKFYSIRLEGATHTNQTNQTIQKYENDQSAYPLDSINNHSINSGSLHENSFSPFFQNYPQRDLIVKFKQNQIKIPGSLGDPLFHDEQKLKSFREKYLLRERYSQRQQSQSPRAFQEVKIKNQSSLPKNRSMVSDNNESLQVFITDSIQIHDPTQQQQLKKREQKSSQQALEEKKNQLNEQRKMKMAHRRQNVLEKLLKDEIELQRKKELTIQIKQQKEEQARKFLEQEEQLRLEQLKKYRSERIKMIKILKQMKERGDSDEEIEAYKQYIDGLNPLNIQKDQELEEKKKEAELKKQKELEQKKKRYKLHDMILKRLFLKIKKCDIDNDTIVTGSVERVKEFQKKLLLQMRKNQDKQGMQQDFKLILKDLQRSVQLKK